MIHWLNPGGQETLLNLVENLDQQRLERAEIRIKHTNTLKKSDSENGK